MYSAPFEEGQVPHYTEDEIAFENSLNIPAVTILINMLSGTIKTNKNKDTFEEILQMMNSEDILAKKTTYLERVNNRPSTTVKITSPTADVDSNVFRDIFKMMTTHYMLNEIPSIITSARDSKQRMVDIQ